MLSKVTILFDSHRCIILLKDGCDTPYIMGFMNVAAFAVIIDTADNAGVCYLGYWGILY